MYVYRAYQYTVVDLFNRLVCAFSVLIQVVIHVYCNTLMEILSLHLKVKLNVALVKI